ncbi:MAG: hypothetical protein K9G46_01905 [Flavobacteriales bacterium]|nr:hypothetical protein [Flavobacteriales bacterium]
MKSDFIPIKLVDIDAWEGRFLTALNQQAASLGITPQQLIDITQKITNHREAYVAAEEAKKVAKSKVAHMQALKVDTIRSIRKMVRQIKSSPTYASANAHSLGVIGPEDSKELTSPKLKARSVGGRAVISYRKYRSHGIYLYGKRGNETSLTLLAVDTRSPYVDTRPNLDPNAPEQREYAARYMLNDEPVGQMGNIHLLLVAPGDH